MSESRSSSTGGNGSRPDPDRRSPDGAGPVRLSALRAGDSARLHQRQLSEGENCLLAAMGLTEGCRLVVRSHGDPCIVEVRATRIGLARSVAERLLVLADLDAG